MWRACFLILTLMSASVAIAAGAPTQSADEQAIQETVAQLFQAVEKQDLAAVMAPWSSRAPQYNTFKNWFQHNFTVFKGTRISRLAFTHWQKTGNQMAVLIRFDREERNQFEEPMFYTGSVWASRFVNEEGKWLLMEVHDPIPAFGNHLVLAANDEARRQLLHGAPHLWGGHLIHFFSSLTAQNAQAKRFAEARRVADIGIEVATAVADKRELAKSHLNRGQLFITMSLDEEARREFQRALSLFEEINDSHGKAWAQYEVARTFQLKGESQQALQQLDVAAKFAHEAPARRTLAKILFEKGAIHLFLGEYDAAITVLGESLAISSKMGDQVAEAMTLTAIGEVYIYSGNYDVALARLQKGKELAQRANLAYLAQRAELEHIEKQAINGIALVHQASGKYLEALTGFEQVFNFALQTKDYLMQAMTLNNLGLVQMVLGRHAKAKESFATGLKIARDNGEPYPETKLLSNISLLFFSEDNYEEALKHAEKSLAILTKHGLKPGEITARTLLGMIYKEKEDNAKAREYFRSALEVIKPLPGNAETVMMLVGIAYSLSEDKKYDDAVAVMQQALEVSEAIRQPILLYLTYERLGFLHAEQQQWAIATGYYKKAIERVEYIRSQSKEPFIQTDAFGRFLSHGSPYFGLLKSMLKTGSPVSEAFAISEQGKARTLVELMGSNKVKLIDGLSFQEREDEQRLRSKLLEIMAQLNRQAVTPDAQERLSRLIRERDEARDAYSRFRSSLYLKYPKQRLRDAQFDPLTLAQLDRTLFSVAPNACLLSYLIDEDESMLLVVSRGQPGQPQLTFHTLKGEDGDDVTQKQVSREVKKLRARCAFDEGAYKPYARTLYNLLVRVAEKEIAGKSHIFIIPDGPLHDLPFQVLLNGQDEHLLDKATISYAPSVGVLLEMMKLAEQRRKAKTYTQPIFALGLKLFPDHAEYQNQKLPEAEAQAVAIARLFGVKPVIGAEATRAKAVAEMEKARYVHFATHGEVNSAMPMYSAILLGKGVDDDGALYAGDLLDMNLQAELVTVSACDTALGQQVNGEGLLGLTWALFIGGTPSSVVTQWRVRDDSMNRLMVEFYRQLRDSEAQGTPVSKAEALKRAQMQIRKEPRYSHPYYWAPTILVGDWR